MTATPSLSHVVFMTRQFDAMLDWYKLVFGARVVHQDPALAFMTYDDEHHRFAFANLDVLKPESSGSTRGEIGVNHVAFTYPDLDDLLETYERLKGKGVTPYWPVHHGFTLSLYYLDPDGNRLELQVEAMSREEADDFIHSGAFSDNPIGIRFDPDALLRAHRAGESKQALLAIPQGPPSEIPLEHGIA